MIVYLDIVREAVLLRETLASANQRSVVGNQDRDHRGPLALGGIKAVKDLLKLGLASRDRGLIGH